MKEARCDGGCMRMDDSAGREMKKKRVMGFRR